MAVAVEFSPRALDHIKRHRKREQRIIIDAIAARLTHQPEKPTRHRKILEDNPLAPWELRVATLVISTT